jgi:hypothetical protein
VPATDGKPPPLRRRTATVASWLLTVQAVLLLASVATAARDLGRVSDQLAAAVRAAPASASHLGEAHRAMVSTDRGIVIYAATFAVLFLWSAWRLQRAVRGYRPDQTRRLRGAIGAVCGAAIACCALTIFFGITSPSPDAITLVDAIPRVSGGQQLLNLLGSGWVLTPFVALATAILVALPPSAAVRDNLFKVDDAPSD